ncbi:MAG TPA: alpha/beta fold hydrolase [Candidatus Competibacteraceae bacterium]|nr:alpha/beta fold hydrolase [Candidatus Competibacteraceae bacterium]
MTPEAATCRPVREGLAAGTAYRVCGAGEPLVFIHGVGMNKEVWEPQVSAFAADYRVISYDMLGHGGSVLPPEAPTLGDYARQLARLLDALDIGAANVVGHSMGALVALAFALDHPERVLRLVALNAVYQRSAEQREAVISRATALAVCGVGDTVEGTLSRWFGDGQDGRQAEQAARIRAWLQAVDPVGYARTYRLFATADDAVADRLHTLRVPALFMTGEHDPNSTPAMSQNMAAATPMGRVLVVPGERHMMAYAAPERINPLLRQFLSETAARLQC